MKAALLSMWLVASLLVGSTAGAQNLALNKTPTASSQVQSAANAFDEDADTRWESDFSDPQYLEIDLGSLQKVDRIHLLWQTALGKAYTLEVSADNSTWTTVAQETNNADKDKDYSKLVNSSGGASASVRYVRMSGTQRATQYGYSLFEFEVYNYSASDNLATGKQGVASSSQGGFPPNQAFDNISNTRWGSEYDSSITSIPPDSNYVYVDLRGTATITQISLYWQTAYGQDFKLEISDDAQNWKGLIRVTGNTQTTNNLAVSGTGRYVRMHGLKRATQYGYSLWEFQIFGTLIPLPVSLTSFSAATQGAGVSLRWTTASEWNDVGFGVQRSADGATFTDLAFVAGAGNSQTTQTYTYHDAAPLPATAYYRLAQRDTNGRTTYSAVQAVAAATVATLGMYPNPTAGQATLEWAAPAAGAGRWYLATSTGQVVHTEPLASQAGFNSLAISLAPYAAGTYFLTVEAAGTVRRALVQKAY